MISFCETLHDWPEHYNRTAIPMYHHHLFFLSLALFWHANYECSHIVTLVINFHVMYLELFIRYPGISKAAFFNLKVLRGQVSPRIGLMVPLEFFKAGLLVLSFVISLRGFVTQSVSHILIKNFSILIN